jgi:tetratricopeptide (TPR) repeat protein
MLVSRLKLKWIVVALVGLGLTTAAIGSMLADGQPPETPVPPVAERKNDDKANPKPENPAADGIAWGETIEGLKVGISFRAGEEHECRIGGSATFVVYLRNEGKTPISIAHNENVFDEFLPSVQDANGQKVKVYPGPMFLGQVSRVDRTLHEGETIRLGTAWFLIKGTSWRGTVVSPTLRAEPGKYRVSCANFPFRRKGKDLDQMLWSTGWVDLAIVDQDQPSKEKDDPQGENRADSLAADVESLRNSGKEFRTKAAEAGKEYMALAEQQRTTSEKAKTLRKAAAMFRLADQPSNAVGALQKANKLLNLPDESAGEVWLDLADALVAAKRPNELLDAFKEVMAMSNPISTKTRYRIARHFKDSRKPEFCELARHLYEQIAKQTKLSPAEQEFQERALLDLGDEYIKLNDFSTAEIWLRQQLHTYPTGPQAPLGRLMLGVSLLQLASVTSPTSPPPAKVVTLRNEALKLFREIVALEDEKLKKTGTLNETDAWLRAQAAIRILQTYLQMKNHTDLLGESADSLQHYRGTVDELIIWSLMYHSFNQQGDRVKAFQARDKLKEVFDTLPAGAFKSCAVEYTREYWEKTWFTPQK